MSNVKLLKPLLLAAAGFVAAPACSLDPPEYSPPDGDVTNPTECVAGSGGSVDGGAGEEPTADGGTPAFVNPLVCGGGSSSLKEELRSRFKYAPGYTPDPAVQQTVTTLMSQMTLTDKAKQMRGMPYGAAGKLNFTDTQRSENTPTIRGYRYRDASRGMNLGEDMAGTQPNAATIGGANVGYSTAFPVSIARGAAFDLDLEYEIGEAIADEMMAAKETLLLAPCMNLIRNPLWGRAQESYSEDSFHTGRLASALTVGIQQHIAANAKHYLGYDIENGRDFNDVSMDEQTLREIYGRHFRMVVQDAGVATVMASYNMVNGEKSTDNRHTLTEVLRDDFGFQGFVLSDWWAMRPQANVDGVDTGTLKSYALYGMQAGLDVELPWALNYGQLENLVSSGGGVTAEDINRGARRVLEQKVRFNSYDVSKNVWGLGSPKSTYRKGRIGGCGLELHKQLAKRAEVEGAVLLKNQGILPIASTAKKIAVIGATVSYDTKNYGKITSETRNFATDLILGDMGSSRVFPDPEQSVTPLQGMKLVAKRRGLDEANIWAGTTAADVKDAEFVVVVAGLTAGDEGEEYTLAADRFSFNMDAKRPDKNLQANLITSVAALGKPMVVVLVGGSIMDLPWLDQVPAVVMAWYPGMRGGEALAELLWGEANFGGKLPITWGRQLSDYEELKAANGATSFDYYVGYSRFDHYNTTPLFPFGHGLSYTQFKYNDLQLGCSELSEGGILPVYVTIENTGSVAGDEIAMVWVSFPQTKARRPPKELKGFARVSLQPGQQKQVLIPIRLKDLDYFDQTKNQWVVEDGPMNIMVGGGSTAPFPLTATVNVRGYAKASSNY